MQKSLTEKEVVLAELIGGLHQIPREEAIAMCLWMENEEMQTKAISGLQELLKKEKNPNIHQIRQVVGDILEEYFPPNSPKVTARVIK